MVHPDRRGPNRSELERTSLADVAYEKLRHLIISGTLRPRDRVVEREVSELMGVSRSPLREAVIRLESDGLLRRLPSGRVIVAALDESETRGLYCVRVALEGYATRLAAEHGRRDVIDHLTEVVEAEISAERRDDRRALYELNVRFHDILYQASEVPELYEEIQVFRRRSFEHRIYDLYFPDEMVVGIEEHKEMVRAVVARDGDGAERLMRRHIARAGDIVVERRVAGAA